MEKQKLLKKIEFEVYKNASGGEAGMKAVKERQKFIKQSDDYLLQLNRQMCRAKFHPQSEKGFINCACEEDDYN